MERYVFQFWFLCCKRCVILEILSDLAESSEYWFFFFKMESQWIPNLKPAAFVELCSSNRIGQQNDCLKKPRWTWKCSCSLSCTCSQRHCHRGCGGLLGFHLWDWTCQLAHLFVMNLYLYWVSTSYAFSWDVSLEKVWTQRRKTNNSK